MKRLTCEMCGGTDLIKEDGVFVCQSCGCKYSIDEAKKMMVDGVVNVTGTVSLENSASIESYLKLASDAKDTQNWGKLEAYAFKILEINPSEAIAWYYKALCEDHRASTSEMNTAITAWGQVASSINSAIDAYQAKAQSDESLTVSDTITLLSMLSFERDFLARYTKTVLRLFVELPYPEHRTCVKAIQQQIKLNSKFIHRTANIINAYHVDIHDAYRREFAEDPTAFEKLSQEFRDILSGDTQLDCLPWIAAMTSKVIQEVCSRLDKHYKDSDLNGALGNVLPKQIGEILDNDVFRFSKFLKEQTMSALSTKRGFSSVATRPIREIFAREELLQMLRLQTLSGDMNLYCLAHPNILGTGNTSDPNVMRLELDLAHAALYDWYPPIKKRIESWVAEDKALGLHSRQERSAAINSLCKDERERRIKSIDYSICQQDPQLVDAQRNLELAQKNKERAASDLSALQNQLASCGLFSFSVKKDLQLQINSAEEELRSAERQCDSCLSSLDTIRTTVHNQKRKEAEASIDLELKDWVSQHLTPQADKLSNLKADLVLKDIEPESTESLKRRLAKVLGTSDKECDRIITKMPYPLILGGSWELVHGVRQELAGVKNANGVTFETRYSDPEVAKCLFTVLIKVDAASQTDDSAKKCSNYLTAAGVEESLAEKIVQESIDSGDYALLPNKFGLDAIGIIATKSILTGHLKYAVL
ncbi:MAG: TFIIB-type zinc finger domain-containing protein [Coriobacteriaceae bacterium]|nr:TFIIB-type zinc finger domain-containing protein [Coriobacteriaceae bacterium]